LSARASSDAWTGNSQARRRLNNLKLERIDGNANATDLAADTPTAWQRFLTDGRQDGEYRLLARDGREVSMRFQARAHHPIAGFHSSRLRLDTADH